MASNRGNLFKNILSLGIVQIANYVLPLISVPIITRIIGPDKYGVIGYAATFIAYFNLLITYGFDLSATRKIIQHKEDKTLLNEVFSQVILSRVILFFISLVLFLLSLEFVPPLAADKKVAIFTFLVCISTVLTPNWVFQAMQELSKIAFLNFLSKLFFTVFILIIITEKKDYIYQPLVLSIISIVISLISFVWAYRRYRLSFVRQSFRQIYRLLWQEKTIFFSLVVISLYTTTNIVVLGLLVPEKEVGYYVAAQRLMDVASSVINLPLAQALFPFIGGAFAVSTQKGLQVIRKVSPIIIIFTSLAVIGMLLLGPTIITLFYGSAFKASIPVFMILSFVPLVVAISNIFGIQTMLNLKMDKAFFRITLIGALIGVLLNIVMIYTMGYIGTAINWLVVEGYITTAMFIYLAKQGIYPITLKEFKASNLKEQVSPLINKFIKKR